VELDCQAFGFDSKYRLIKLYLAMERQNPTLAECFNLCLDAYVPD